MEPFSLGLLICGVFVAVYQMTATPFVLNIVIFCIIPLLCMYGMCVSKYRIPSDTLYYWVYPASSNIVSEEKQFTVDDHDDEITKKLRELTNHIVRDFILSWYMAVTNDVTFVQEAFELFEHILSGARTRVSNIDKERLLANILNELLEHVLLFKRALAKVDWKKCESSNKEDEQRRDQLLAIAYCSESTHPASESLPDSEMEYLRGAVIMVLKGLLPEDYKLTQTPLYLVRELIAQNVLCSLVNLMSDPLWIYNTLEKILSDTGEAEDAEAREISENSNNDGKTHCTQTAETLPNQYEHDSAIRSYLGEGAASNEDNIGAAISESVVGISNSSSIASQLSTESQENFSTVRLDDIPLPLMSSELHFAPEWNDTECDVTAMKKHLVSVAMERAPMEKLFHRIKILDHMIMKENYDGRKKYALYNITYQTREVLQSSQPVGIPSTEGPITQEATNQPEKFVTKKYQVQRRFREFLVLQERLSQNMVARNLIVDAKGPSRMFPVPFGNMDKEYIEQRRKFLQNYLRKVSSIPFISHTKEMREFLAYKMDPRIAYVKKPDSIPRFDKLFKSAIQDLVGSAMMKISSQNTDVVGAYYEKPDATGPSSDEGNFITNEVSNVGAVTKLKNKVFGVSKHHSHDKPAITRTNRQFANFEDPRSDVTPKWKKEKEVDLFAADTSSNPWPPVRGYGDGCEESNTASSYINPAVLPTTLLLKLVYRVWDVKPGKHSLATVCFTKYIQAYLANKVDELSSAKAWTKYLRQLHESLWPGGKWESSDVDRVTWDTSPDQVKSRTIERAQQCLEEELPGALKHLMTENAYKSGIKQLLYSFQNTNINRQLICRLLDLILSELFPDSELVAQRSHILLNANNGLPHCSGDG